MKRVLKMYDVKMMEVDYRNGWLNTKAVAFTEGKSISEEFIWSVVKQKLFCSSKEEEKKKP